MTTANIGAPTTIAPMNGRPTGDPRAAHPPEVEAQPSEVDRITLGSSGDAAAPATAVPPDASREPHSRRVASTVLRVAGAAVGLGTPLVVLALTYTDASLGLQSFSAIAAAALTGAALICLGDQV